MLRGIPADSDSAIAATEATKTAGIAATTAETVALCVR